MNLLVMILACSNFCWHHLGLGSVGSQFLFSRNGVSEFLPFDVPSLFPHRWLRKIRCGRRRRRRVDSAEVRRRHWALQWRFSQA